MSILNPYVPCSCNSGKKIKFCCGAITKKSNQEIGSFLSVMPLYKALATANWQGAGMAQVCIVKEMFNDLFACGIYLVDSWCLGIKDAGLALNKSKSEIDEMLLDWKLRDGVKPIQYEDARSLIFGALNYAKNIGFDPHPDWYAAKWILEPERHFDNKYTFGREGKPFYVTGPYDDEERNVKEIITKVSRHGGNWVRPMF